METFFEDNAWMSAILIMGAALEAIRRWVWPSLISVVHYVESLPTLIDIAEQFEKNDGNSLRDRIDTIHLRLENIEQQLEQVLTEKG